MSYDGEIDWLGQEASVTLYCDSRDSFAADAALENLRKIAAGAAGGLYIISESFLKFTKDG